MNEWEKPVVVVSKCLGFDACRFNGDVIADKFIEKLAQLVTFIPVCPEVEIGLGTPRKPIRLVKEGRGFKLIQPETGADLTDKMAAFSDVFLAGLQNVDGFILKNRSPSCAINDAKLMAGVDKPHTVRKQGGIFGDKVKERFSHLAVEDEGRLKNFSIREHFLTKLFTIARFRHLKEQHNYNDLLMFHTKNKYLFMAYDQLKLKELGRIVANHERRGSKELFALYGEKLYDILAEPTAFTAYINVLYHVMGYFSSYLSDGEKKYFIGLIEQYRHHTVPLSSPMGVLQSWVIRFNNAYLASQTIFNPYPEELIEITDSGKGRNFA
ncbi:MULTISPECIES: YbgA family protein [Bacillaceae]|uniref:DUF523 and DUF1722 domain-containing protein n=1 Tax=Evansella alkalicola TaxID=745819 RepID=A0ABS6JXB4_9BACI|nr:MULTISPECIES: DUF523 and DUF1722 domain-containing protein [Bacillaceae]MBU9723230.1 DUF523 and DUF1722 domain-containing protein [Bacillus alkalicola]